MRVINQLAYSGLREADKLIAVGEEIGTKLKTFNHLSGCRELQKHTISTRTEILKDTIGLSSDDKILVLSGSVVQGLRTYWKRLPDFLKRPPWVWLVPCERNENQSTNKSPNQTWRSGSFSALRSRGTTVRFHRRCRDNYCCY